RGVKSTIINCRKSRTNIFKINSYHHKCRNDIYSSHYRHNTPGNFTNTSNTTNDHRSHQCSKGKAEIESVPLHELKLACQDLKRLVCLKHITSAHGGTYTQHGKEYREELTQPFHISFLKPVFQVIHGP